MQDHAMLINNGKYIYITCHTIDLMGLGKNGEDTFLTCMISTWVSPGRIQHVL